MLKITKWKKVVALGLAILMFAIPITSLLAQEKMSEYVQGKMDGERDAKGNPLWFLAGLGCGIIGVGAAYLVKPNPAAHLLVGKSSEYVLGYTEGYQNKARDQNSMYACIGAITWGVIYLVAVGGLEEETE